VAYNRNMFDFFRRLFNKRKQYTEKAIAADFVRAVFADAADVLPRICASLEDILGTLRLADRERALQDVAAAFVALELPALPNLFSLSQANRLRSQVLDYLRFKHGEYATSEVQAYEEIFRGELRVGSNPVERVSERLLHRLTHLDVSYGMDAFTVEPIRTAAISAWAAGMCGRWKRLRDLFEIIEG
jgi:hypothetical protein